MSSIDERIVRITFDNKEFEARVSSTIKSIEKLNQTLKSSGNSDALSGISKGAGSAIEGMSGLDRGVSSVSKGLSALGVMGVTALANITNSAVNAGKNLAKSLTIEPIMSGFSEYETKMGAIQTILTNTAHLGTNLDDVNKVLGDLNTYADKTIYNFAEMTKNIGTFTAAGVDLDTSAAAIKGIANLAAASGSNSQQASTAMYQLSQALAAGRVSLADWNSVVNAGMGGKLFQDALIRTSEQLGTGADAMIKKYGSFRDSLTQGEWLTTEVLTETLKQLSGAYTEADLIAQGYTKSQAQQIVELAKNASAAATEVKTVTQLVDTMKESVQSGWAQSWEYIIGDKEQATATLTAISQGFESIIGPSTEARNKMLEFWNQNGGRDAVVKGLTNVFQGLGTVMKSIGSAWKEVFPSMTGQKLVDLSNKFKAFTERMKVSDSTASKIKDTFKGVFSVFGLLKDAVMAVIKALSPIGSLFMVVGSAVLSVTASIGRFVSSLGDAASKSGVFDKIGSGIRSAFSGLGSIFSGVIKSIGSVFDKLSSFDISGVFGFIGDAGKRIGDGLGSILKGIGSAIGSINLDTIFGAINIGLLGGLVKSVKGIFDKLVDPVKEAAKSISGIADNFANALDSIRKPLEVWQSNLQASTLLKIATAIGILAASLVALGTLNMDELSTGLVGITVIFAELVAVTAALTKMVDGKSIKGLTQIGISLTLLATAVGILSLSMKSLSELNWNEIAKGLTSVAGLMAILVASTHLIDTSSKGMTKTAAGMVVFAAALLVMGEAVEKLGKLKPAELTKGLIG